MATQDTMECGERSSEEKRRYHLERQAAKRDLSKFHLQRQTAMKDLNNNNSTLIEDATSTLPPLSTKNEEQKKPSMTKIPIWSTHDKNKFVTNVTVPRAIVAAPHNVKKARASLHKVIGACQTKMKEQGMRRIKRGLLNTISHQSDNNDDNKSCQTTGSSTDAIRQHHDPFPKISRSRTIHFDKNGTIVTQHQWIQTCKRRGVCPGCERRTHKVKMTCIVGLTNDEVYNGICLICNPEAAPPKESHGAATKFSSDSSDCSRNGGSLRRYRQMLSSDDDCFDHDTNSIDETQTKTTTPTDADHSTTRSSSKSQPQDPNSSPSSLITSRQADISHTSVISTTSSTRMSSSSNSSTTDITLIYNPNQPSFSTLTLPPGTNALRHPDCPLQSVHEFMSLHPHSYSVQLLCLRQIANAGHIDDDFLSQYIIPLINCTTLTFFGSNDDTIFREAMMALWRLASSEQSIVSVLIAQTQGLLNRMAQCVAGFNHDRNVMTIVSSLISCVARNGGQEVMESIGESGVIDALVECFTVYRGEKGVLEIMGKFFWCLTESEECVPEARIYYRELFKGLPVIHAVIKGMEKNVADLNGWEWACRFLVCYEAQMEQIVSLAGLSRLMNIGTMIIVSCHEQQQQFVGVEYWAWRLLHDTMERKMRLFEGNNGGAGDVSKDVSTVTYLMTTGGSDDRNNDNDNTSNGYSIRQEWGLRVLGLILSHCKRNEMLSLKSDDVGKILDLLKNSSVDGADGIITTLAAYCIFQLSAGPLNIKSILVNRGIHHKMLRLMAALDDNRPLVTYCCGFFYHFSLNSNDISNMMMASESTNNDEDSFLSSLCDVISSLTKQQEEREQEQLPSHNKDSALAEYLFKTLSNIIYHDIIHPDNYNMIINTIVSFMKHYHESRTVRIEGCHALGNLFTQKSIALSSASPAPFRRSSSSSPSYSQQHGYSRSSTRSLRSSTSSNQENDDELDMDDIVTVILNTATTAFDDDDGDDIHEAICFSFSSLVTLLSRDRETQCIIAEYILHVIIPHYYCDKDGDKDGEKYMGLNNSDATSVSIKRYAIGTLSYLIPAINATNRQATTASTPSSSCLPFILHAMASHPRDNLLQEYSCTTLTNMIRVEMTISPRLIMTIWDAVWTVLKNYIMKGDDNSSSNNDAGMIFGVQREACAALGMLSKCLDNTVIQEMAMRESSPEEMEQQQQQQEQRQPIEAISNVLRLLTNVLEQQYNPTNNSDVLYCWNECLCTIHELTSHYEAMDSIPVKLKIDLSDCIVKIISSRLLQHEQNQTHNGNNGVIISCHKHALGALFNLSCSPNNNDNSSNDTTRTTTSQQQPSPSSMTDTLAARGHEQSHHDGQIHIISSLVILIVELMSKHLIDGYLPVCEMGCELLSRLAFQQQHQLPSSCSIIDDLSPVVKMNVVTTALEIMSMYSLIEILQQHACVALVTFGGISDGDGMRRRTAVYGDAITLIHDQRGAELVVNLMRRYSANVELQVHAMRILYGVLGLEKEARWVDDVENEDYDMMINDGGRYDGDNNNDDDGGYANDMIEGNLCVLIQAVIDTMVAIPDIARLHEDGLGVLIIAMMKMVTATTSKKTVMKLMKSHVEVEKVVVSLKECLSWIMMKYISNPCIQLRSLKLLQLVLHFEGNNNNDNDSRDDNKGKLSSTSLIWNDKIITAIVTSMMTHIDRLSIQSLSCSLLQSLSQRQPLSSSHNNNNNENCKISASLSRQKQIICDNGGIDAVIFAMKAHFDDKKFLIVAFDTLAHLIPCSAKMTKARDVKMRCEDTTIPIVETARALEDLLIRIGRYYYDALDLQEKGSVLLIIIDRILHL